MTRNGTETRRRRSITRTAICSASACATARAATRAAERPAERADRGCERAARGGAVAAAAEARGMSERGRLTSDVGPWGALPAWLYACCGHTAIALFGLLAARYADTDGVAFPSQIGRA